MLGASFFRDRSENLVERGQHRLAVGEVEFDAADIGFVGDGFRMQFQHHRISHRLGEFHGLVAGDGNFRGHGRDAVRGEQFFRFKFRQRGAALFAHFGDDRVRGFASRAHVAGVHLRMLGDFIQMVQVVAVLPHVGEGAGGGVGIVEGRDADAVEDVVAGGHHRAAHPTGEDRLAFDLRVGAKFFRRLGRVGHVLRGQDDHQAVAVRVVGRDLQRLCVTVGSGVAENVDRIVPAPVRRQKRVEFPVGFFRQFGELSAADDQRVGGEHAGSAGIGQDGQARALRSRLFAEHFGHVEQFGNRIHAQHTGAHEGGVEHFEAAGQRSGVGSGGLGGGFGATGLDDDDRFVQRDLAGGGQEVARVADRLHVNHDALGARVVADVVDQVAEIDVEHRADRDEGAEADLLANTPVEHRGAQRAALADECHVAGAGHDAAERRVQAGDRVHHAEAVRADQAHVAAAGVDQNLTFELDARRAEFLEPGGNHNAAFYPGGDAFGHEVRHQLGLGHDNREINLLRHRGDGRVGLDAEDARAFRIHREHHAAKRIADQVPQHGAADTAHGFRCADHRHRLRGEDVVQRVLAILENVARGIDHKIFLRGVGGDGNGLAHGVGCPSFNSFNSSICFR